jgi:cytochrome P450
MSQGLRRPAGPRVFPLLGALPLIARDPLAFYSRMSCDFGPISYAPVVRSELYVVGGPELVDELLTVRHKSLIKDSITRALRPLVGDGLLTSEGELWKRQRKLSAPLFAPKRLLSYEQAMVDCAQRAFASFQHGQRRDFHVDSMAVTLEVVARTLLGISDPTQLAEVGQLVDTVLAYYAERLHSWGVLLPLDFPTPAYRRFVRAKRELDALVRGVIDHVRRQDADADHLLARLVRARSDDGQGMSEQQLLDEAVTMLLAGHETTALTLMFTVYLLSRHPPEAAKLQQEIDDVLGGRPVRVSDLEHMPVLDSVLRESLRLYPPAYVFAREATESFELGGHQLPAGAQILISPYAIQRNPRLWSQPTRFDPSRWLTGEARKLPRFAYLPFGGGNRICIGSHFAMQEAALLMATLLQQVALDVQPGFQLQLEPVVTLRSRSGLPVRVRRHATRAARPVHGAPTACPHEGSSSAE